MGDKTQTLYKDGDSPSKSPTGKSAQSSNPSDVPEGKKGYNIVKLNMGGKTSVIRDDSKELDITIPKKSEKNHGMKLRNRYKINYNIQGRRSRGGDLCLQFSPSDRTDKTQSLAWFTCCAGRARPESRAAWRPRARLGRPSRNSQRSVQGQCWVAWTSRTSSPHERIQIM